MMTPKNIKAKTAIEYFKKGYYEKGQWLGQGAEKLGLKGEINDYKVYENIVNGLSPDGKQRLNKREVHEDKRKAAVDCTFEAPKSVSITALIGGDERLIEAHNQAVEEVLQLMEERYAKTRIVLDSKVQKVIKTGNMVIAKHDHFESRELDPHVHSHCLVMNITQALNGEWYSHLNDDIFHYQKLLGMMYQHRLAAKLEKIGYETEWKENGQFEIKGYPEEHLMAMSKRRQQILEVAGAGASWLERERAWKKTRRNKEYVPLDELQVGWREKAKEIKLKIVRPRESKLEPAQELEVVQASQKNLQKVFDDAIKHCSEKRVAFKAEDIERFILSHSRHTIDVDALQPLIDSSPELIHLKEKDGVRYTTQTAVLRELATIELMKQGQGVVGAIAHPEVVEHHLEQIKLSQNRELNQGQRKAVLMALGTTDQFIAWQGVAGAGKTYALNEVKALAEERGYIVKGFAPSAKAARVLSLDLNASTQTVARLLASKLPKKMQPNQIWVVDESGLMSAGDVYRLLERAKKEQARVILVGDTKQLSAIEAGAPFKLLQQAGIKTAYLQESQRQKDSPKLKLAVDALAEGRIDDGFNLLVANGCIQQVTKETKVDEIVAAYQKLTLEERSKTLLLAGTHDERRRITNALRQVLRSEGSLGDDVTLTQLKTKDLSDVEKESYISQFAIGNMVMPLRDYKRKGLTKNELYEVTGKTKDHLQLLGADGTQLEVGLDFKKAIFSKEEIQIAVGDRLMWKKNNQARKQVNGQEVIVRGINGTQVEIEEQDGKMQTIDLAQPHHLDHAIVRTTYSSQGETANRVLIAADSTIGKESFYVAASRARLHLCFYTEDSSALLEWAKESKAQENSLDLIRQQVKEKMAAEVLVGAVQAKSSQPSSRTTDEPQMKGKTSSPTSNVTTPSQVAPPIKRTAENPERVKVSNQPSQQPPVKRSTEKQTDIAALMKSDAIKPKRLVPVEAFWTPGSAGVAPFNIELAHWKELVEGSAIHPNLAQGNIQSVAGKGVYDRLLSTRLEKIGGSGQYVTQPAAKLMKAYEQVAEGGWWAKAGIDARSVPSLQLGKQPDLKLWGSFKADNPRVDAEKSHTKGKTEYIKYEHPLGEERQLFLFEVPDALAERIYNKHGIEPTEVEKQSGFWHIVHKYNLPVTITEGAKKTLSSLSQGEITIGLSGVNGGYSSRDQNKNRLEQRVLHPELKVFATPGREFRFAFDHDIKLSTIFNVRRELVRTGELLELEGCKVRVVQWEGDKGLDDLIVNQGPLAYTQAQASTIPLASDAKKHYRAEYTRLSKQVRDEQPALTGEAIDVEVYKLAVLKGDIRDGARTIAQSNQVRTFQTELPLQSARAAKLAFIQRIEQQLYQPKIGETCLDELTSQQQVSPVTIQLSDSLAEIAQEMALAITEAAEEQEIEHLVAATTALLQHLTQGQRRTVSPIKALANAIEEQSALEAVAPALTVALQTLSQSLNRLQEVQPLKPLAALNEQSQSYNNLQQPEQSHELTDQSIRTLNSRQLPGLDVRGDQTLDRAHQEPGAEATRADRSPHAIARELSQAISRTTEQQEAEQIAGAIAALNHSYSEYDFSITGTEALRGAVERYHAAVTANFRQQTARQLVEAVADCVQQSTVVESAPIAQAIGALTEQLTQHSSKESAQAVARLNTALSGYLLIVEAMPVASSYLNPQVVEQSLNAIENYIQGASIDSAPIAQALENLTVQLNQVQSLDNRAVQHQLHGDTTIGAIDQINTAIADYLQQIELLSIIPDSRLQGTEQLLNAMANYLEGATLNSEPFVQAVQSVSAQLTQLQNLETTGTIQGLDKAISEYLQQIEQSSAVPVVNKQTTQNLIDAIAEYIEQETIDVSPVSSALKELSGQLNQFQTSKTTRAVEALNTVKSVPDTPQPPIDDGSEWVRVKTDRTQLSKFNNQIGVVCGRIRVAGSEEVVVRIGKYTPGFDPSQLKPVSSVPKLEGQQGNEQLLQELAGAEVVNRLNDRDFMLLQQSVVDYFDASPPRPPSVAEQQLIQHEIDKLVKQIDSLWSKQAEQVKLVELMRKNPFHLWNKKYDEAFAQLEKTMSLINQSITQKDQKESQFKEWGKQGEAHQNWENNPRTIEMRKIAEILKLQEMQERSANIQQAIQQEQMRQTSLGRTQQQNQEQGQRRGRGR